MTRFTIENIRSWEPCYDPEIHLPRLWSGVALDILKHDTIPPEDKIWVVCRRGIIDEKTRRLFAVHCARSVEHLLADDRTRNAINVTERFANGEATEQEMADAGVTASRANAKNWPAAIVVLFAVRGDAFGASCIAREVIPKAVTAQMAKLIEMIEGGEK